MLHVTPTGVRLEAWVVPGAARSEIVGPHGDALKIRVAAPAEKGAANRELARLLEALTGSSVEILRGAGRRRKSVHIDSDDLDGIAELLGVATR